MLGYHDVECLVVNEDYFLSVEIFVWGEENEWNRCVENKLWDCDEPIVNYSPYLFSSFLHFLYTSRLFHNISDIFQSFLQLSIEFSHIVEFLSFIISKTNNNTNNRFRLFHKISFLHINDIWIENIILTTSTQNWDESVSPISYSEIIH